jgi:GWxTD domain-containing protein
MLLRSLIFFILVYSAFGQDRGFLDKKNLYDFGEQLYTEVHYLPAESPDSVKVITLYRFSYNSIGFEKAGLMQLNNNLFYSVPQFEIEFKDDEGIIREREISQDSVFTDDYERTISKTDYIYGGFVSGLESGKYDYEIRLSDNNIKNIKRKTIKDTVNHKFDDNQSQGQPIFTYIKSDKENEYVPYIMNSRMDFDSYNKMIIIPVYYKGDFVKYHIECKFKEKTKKFGLTWDTDIKLNKTLIPEKNSTLELTFLSQEGIILKSKPIINDDKTEYFRGLLYIDLSVEELVPGNYELKVVKSGTGDTITHNFEIVWEDMPVILQRPEYAVESMYYILTDEEYEEMKDVDEDDYSKEILKYWKKEDPTPSTPFNEAMAEYFKRVDYAMFNMRTLSQKNGIKTDRGKVYILYGAPSKIDRTLNDNKTYEIWEYAHLDKKFIFETISQGVFKLIKIEEGK